MKIDSGDSELSIALMNSVPAHARCPGTRNVK